MRLFAARSGAALALSEEACDEQQTLFRFPQNDGLEEASGVARVEARRQLTDASPLEASGAV